MEDIIELCGRLPLALAAVSARAAAHPDFPLASIAADLRRAQGRLDAFTAAGGAADARAVFSSSYRRLSPQAHRLFRLLPLQPAADITPAASASLLGVPPEQASRLVVELTNAVRTRRCQDRAAQGPGPVWCGPMATPVRGSMTETMPSAAGLLGRRAELAGLAELLDGPGGSAMVVLGEAGSGKTALFEGPGVPALRRKWFSTGGHYGSRM